MGAVTTRTEFGDPRGLRGWVAAHVVARLTGEANRWMVECLELGPDDRFLDVGCGPGLAVASATDVHCARAVGVDVSPVMVRQARRRNRRAIRSGRVEFHCADAARLPFPDGSFTAAGSLNSLQFWPSTEDGLGELERVLAPGGRVAIVVMARTDDHPGPALPPWMDDIAAGMADAGFTDVRSESRTFGGVPHRALLGRVTEKKKGAPLDPTADGVRKGAGT